MQIETQEPGGSFASIEDAANAYVGTTEEENPATDNLDQELPAEEETPVEADEDDELLAEEEGDVQDEDENGSDPEPAGGRFVSDDAKVKLEDGTVITVADLRKNNLFQADYTRKAMEVAETRKAVDADKSRVQQLESALAQQRETIAAVASAFLPKPPDPSMLETDFIGYTMQKDAYERQTALVQRLIADHQQAKQRQHQEQEGSTVETRKEEAKKLFERAPEFAKPEVYQKFWDDAVKAGSDYGFSADELNGVTDHRQYLVLKDAIAYRRLKAKNAEAKAKASGKPPVMTGGNRRSPDAARQQASNAALARLNSTGSLRDGIAALVALEKG